jgi:hypothetical protein
LTLPSEKDLLGKVAAIQAKTGQNALKRTKPGIFYERQRLYAYDAMPSTIIEMLGFKKNFLAYKADVELLRSDLERDVKNHTRLEDSELFA